MNDLRLALLQCESMPGDVAANMRRLAQACEDAAHAGAHLLVTPEMFLTGYNIGRAAVDAFAAVAAFADGAQHRERVEAVAAIARTHGIAIVFGHPERVPGGGVANTAVCVNAGGQVLGRYRKTHLFGDLDRDMFSAGAGDEALFEVRGWNIGLLICYDVEFAENARRLALQGADLIVVPTANMVGFDFVAQHLVPTRAYENQVFVAYANFCGREAELAYGGLSCVAAPDGTVPARGGRLPALVMADLKSEALVEGRQRLRHLADFRGMRDAGR
jgi:predicted amidohydrolase